MKNFPEFSGKSQQGMVLLVTLIMVGIMSVIAVSAIRGSSMQEAMAGNLHDRNLAFQAAEAGLRYAEEDMANNSAGYKFDETEDGLYKDQNKPLSSEGSIKNWTPEQWAANSIQLDDDDLSVEFPAYPQYVVEKIGTFSGADGTSTVYRITSRAFGLTGGSEVIVQSTYEVSNSVPAP
jgi:type IV pilus assembly protein PilX